ncbi:MAG: extracellular solute-binding protein [Nitriliruptorales bacterium]|nr:extracellular solute-binding protein [Nitriliruptorales bacterium]
MRVKRRVKRPAVLHLLSGAVLLALLAACGEAESGSDAADTPAATDTGSAEAAGQSVPDALEALEGLSADERREQLIQLALEEGGRVSVYTSMNSETADAAAEAFEADTGVAVLSYRAGAEDVRTRILQEAEANRVDVDVAWIGDSRLVPIREAGILTPYTSPHQDDLVEGAVSEYWTLNHYNIYTIAWNTDRVAEGEQPQSYEDLTDPKWDGIMTLEPSDADWYWSLSNYLREDQGFSEEELEQYWQDVTSGVDFNSGHTSTRALLVAGRYAVFASDFSKGIELEKVDGAPVEWLPAIEPLFATPEAAAIAAATPRPAAAILFMDWLISDGQQVLYDLEVDVTRTDLQALDDLEIRFVDAEEWAEVEADMVEEYQSRSGG